MAGAPPTSSASVCGALAGPDRLRWRSCTANFWLYLLATFCGGLYAASHMSYRFGAADTASPEFKPKAVAWVMAGGLFAAILGPQLVIFTKDLMPPYLFAASYLGQGAVRRHGRASSSCCSSARRAWRTSRSAKAGGRSREIVAPAALHRRGRVRGRELRADEPDDDLGAARDVRLRAFGRPTPRSASSGTCSRCMRRASSPAR